MKKLIILFFAFYAISFSQITQNTKALDFRGLKLGEATKEDFIEMFPDYFTQGEGDAALYGAESTLMGMEGLVIAGFINNVLESISFMTTHDRVNSYNFILDYYKFQEELTKKYGDYDSFNTEWLNERYSENSLDYGKAVIYGHLELETTWEMQNGSVKLTIKGENYTAKIYMMQVSNKYIELIQKQAKKPSF